MLILQAFCCFFLYKEKFLVFINFPLYFLLLLDIMKVGKLYLKNSVKQEEKQMIKEFIEAMQENTEYGFIANHYNDFSKQELVNILKEYIFAVLQEEKAKEIKTAIIEELEYYTEEEQETKAPFKNENIYTLTEELIESEMI